MKLLNSVALTTILLAGALTAVADERYSDEYAPATSDFYSPIAVAARAATQQYRSLAAAKAAGYVVQATACVSGDDHGAMGIHYANPTIVGSGMLNLTEPALLLYEPQANGNLELVGMEYVLPLPLWTSGGPNRDPNTPPPPGAQMPYLDGQQMNYLAQPNRYGQGNSFYLHIWAWRYNPKGLFSDWNPNVTCAKSRH